MLAFKPMIDFATSSMTFGEWVKSVMAEKGLTVLVCCRRAVDENGRPMAHSQWNAIMEDEPRRADGSPPERSSKTVKRVALGLDVPESEARQAAGLFVPNAYQSIPPDAPLNHFINYDTGEILIIDSPSRVRPATPEEQRRVVLQILKERNQTDERLKRMEALLERLIDQAKD